MAFPGPYSSPITNEAGELLGWDNYDPDFEWEPSEEDERRWQAEEAAAEDAYHYALDSDASDEDAEEFSRYRIKQKGVSTEDAWRTWLAKKLADT